VPEAWEKEGAEAPSFPLEPLSSVSSGAAGGGQV